MSSVLSEDPPTAEELALNEVLERWVAQQTEPLAESQLRERVLSKLDALAKSWIKSVTIKEFGWKTSLAEEVGGRIFTTGSYRHGVHKSGSDIDAVLIVPEHITKEHFFDSFARILQAHPSTSEISFAPEATVPIIGLLFDGVALDLSFASVRRKSVPNNIDILDDNVLRGLDVVTARSINGVRVADLLLKMVPNVRTFRPALRFIKQWATVKGIYGTKFGYPPGIAWGILVAKICQCYPNQCAAGLVIRFFRFYQSWFNPNPAATRNQRNSSIYLTSTLTPTINIPGLSCWDPKHSTRDAQALFPVITPAYPYMNSCYAITKTTLQTICDEFKTGHKYFASVMGKTAAAAEARESFNDLEFGVIEKVLEPLPFFTSFRFFMHITASATKFDDYTQWADFVESKLRFLWFTGPQRNIALENFPQIRCRMSARRYEDPQQKSYRESLGTSAMKQQKPSAKVAAPAGDASAVKGASSTPGRAPSVAVAAPTKYTAHWYLGLEYVQPPTPPAEEGKPAPKPPQVDMGGVVRSFVEICRDPNFVARNENMMDPVIDIQKVDALPAWLTETDPASTVKKRPRVETSTPARPADGAEAPIEPVAFDADETPAKKAATQANGANGAGTTTPPPPAASAEAAEVAEPAKAVPPPAATDDTGLGIE